jgi:glutamate formiminotransferase/formiminotetrahydrofolate cyclodeaminase
MYEAAATAPERKNLATIRSGEYEGLQAKLQDKSWAPDYGASAFNKKSGATIIGARDFLVAYNVNINTTSVRRANSIAFDVRENGRIRKDETTGKPVIGTDGMPERIPGSCKSVKAIGWYIEEYGIAQISMNLTNIRETPLHEAFEACCNSATSRGMRVTGSELVGLVPKQVLIEAGKYFLQKQKRSSGISEDEIIHIAVKSLGLDELGPFEPRKKIIEFLLEDTSASPLIHKNLVGFANETASESPAPGGGSISAYVGALGVALGTMVANLSAQKQGWESQISYFSEAAEKGQLLKDKLLRLVDEDTRAFDGIMEAFRLPKSNDAEKLARKEAIAAATRHAINIPLEVMETSWKSMEMIAQMAERGNPNSVTDAGVGILCARTAVEGAYLNVCINCKDFDDETFRQDALSKAINILEKANKTAEAVMVNVRALAGA